MKRIQEAMLGLVFMSILLVIGWTIGWKQASIGLVFSLIWFIISLVLLTKPPGVPEIASRDKGSDMPSVRRADPFPVLPTTIRIRISLCVACGVSLLTWVALGW